MEEIENRKRLAILARDSNQEQRTVRYRCRSNRRSKVGELEDRGSGGRLTAPAGDESLCGGRTTGVNLLENAIAGSDQ